MSALQVIWTNQFKKDYKQALKRGNNIELLDDAIRMLAKGEPLPSSMKDHSLTGNWKNYRECHITSDWLLIYRVDNNILVLTLTRTGSHADLFGK